MSKNLQFPLHSGFLALPLEGVTKKEFVALQQSLVKFSDCLTFQNPNSPHLTLYFWTELMEIEYKQVMEQAEKIAAREFLYETYLLIFYFVKIESRLVII